MTLLPQLLIRIVKVIARTSGCRHIQAWPSTASAKVLRPDGGGSASFTRVQAVAAAPTRKLAPSTAIATDERRHDRRHADPLYGGGSTRHESDDIQLVDREQMEERGSRDGGERGCADRLRRHQDGLAARAVEPYARRQSEDDPRREPHR